MKQVQLKNGVVISGTDSQIKDILASAGLKDSDLVDCYNSSSKGLIAISDMDSNHLRNAVIKEIKNTLDALRDLTPEEFWEELWHTDSAGRLLVGKIKMSETARKLVDGLKVRYNQGTF